MTVPAVPAFNTISIIGLGYIGLPAAATLASRGVTVLGVDINERAVDLVNSGAAHIVEPGLDALLQSAVASGRLRAFTTPQKAEAYIIAVPTPFHSETHQPDISYVLAAARSIAPVLQAGNLLILESTVPVGTTQQVSEVIAELRPDLALPHVAGEESTIDIAYCPERILPGHVLRELVENNRAIGGLNSRSAERAAALYRIFVKGDIRLGSAPEVEFVKLAENAFRDVNIAFANEISMVCDKLGLNVWNVIGMANLHPRVNILNPGPGVGGHCIAVDPWFIVSAAPETVRLIRAAREVNDSKPCFVLQKVEAAVARQPDAVIACLGLAFKPDIDDLRESPALAITHELSRRFPGRVVAVEPNIQTPPAGAAFELVSLDTALERAKVLVILVSHREFSGLITPKESEVIDTTGLLR